MQIYVAGLQSKYKDKLNKIINVSSATRLDEITDAITHVLIGDIKKAKNELKVMHSKGLRYINKVQIPFEIEYYLERTNCLFLIFLE